MSIVGNTYLERGGPVKVLAQWRGHGKVNRWMGDKPKRTADDYDEYGWTDDHPVVGENGASGVRLSLSLSKHGPRNVLIQRESGELVVRPFRGLRKPDTHKPESEVG